MGTLGERLEWILANREFTSRRSLSLAAGLSESYVGQVIRGNIKGNVSVDNIKALARAGRVRWEWLADGTEPRDPDQGAKSSPAGSGDQGGHGTHLDPADDESASMAQQAIAMVRSARPFDNQVAGWIAIEIERRQWSGGTLGALVDRVGELLDQREAERKGRPPRVNQPEPEPPRSPPDAPTRKRRER